MTTHLGLPAGVPTTDQVDTSGEETSFQQSEEDTKGYELVPVGDEPDGQGDGSPEEGDGR
jgi:hypothetical protein